MTQPLDPPTRSANGSGEMIHKTAWDAAQPVVKVRFRCEVVSTTREGVLEQLAEVLSAEGYFVSKKIAWEKIGDFRKRIGVRHEGLHRLLESPLCPPVELHRAQNGKGRVLAVCSNPVFETFCSALRGKTPEKSDRPKRKRKSRAKPAHLLQRARMHGPKRNYATT